MLHKHDIKIQSQQGFLTGNGNESITLKAVEYDTENENLAKTVFFRTQMNGGIINDWKRKIIYNKYGELFFTYDGNKYEIHSINNFEIFENAKDILVLD